MKRDLTELSEEAEEFKRNRDAESTYFTSQALLWRIITRKVIEKSTTKKEFKLCEWLVENEYAFDVEEAFENYIKPHWKKMKKQKKKPSE